MKKVWLELYEISSTDTYLKITNFIKKENPKPVGLCGLMLPSLENFELANEYEKGNFSIDGKTKIGQKSDFKNQYLKDVIIQSL